MPLLTSSRHALRHPRSENFSVDFAGVWSTFANGTFTPDLSAPTSSTDPFRGTPFSIGDEHPDRHLLVGVVHAANTIVTTPHNSVTYGGVSATQIATATVATERIFCSFNAIHLPTDPMNVAGLVIASGSDAPNHYVFAFRVVYPNLTAGFSATASDITISTDTLTSTSFSISAGGYMFALAGSTGVTGSSSVIGGTVQRESLAESAITLSVVDTLSQTWSWTGTSALQHTSGIDLNVDGTDGGTTTNRGGLLVGVLNPP